MKRLALLLFALLALGQSSAVDTYTNKSDTVTVKGWRRYYVYGLGDGTLIDPSGTIASFAAGAAVGATTMKLTEIAEEARLTASNNLARMYAVTNLLSTFTRKIFVQAHLYPDLTMFSNCWGRVAREWTDGTNDHCFVYLSREFLSPPILKRTYRSETETNTVEGVWTDFDAPGVIIDGYEGCKEIVYERPEGFRNVNCFAQPYLRFGTPEAGFDFGTRLFLIDGKDYFTGAVTNSLGKIWWFNNGVKVRGEADVE